MSTSYPHVRHVVVVSDTAFIDGGGAAVGLRSAIGLAQAGFRVTVVSAVGPPMEELLDEPNVRVLCSGQEHLLPPSMKAFRQGIWNEAAAKTLEAALVDCSPASTIVHVHGWTKALSPSIFHAATRLGFTVVVTLHDFFSVCPNGSFYIHPEKKICTLAPMGFRCAVTDCDSRNYGFKTYRLARQAIQHNIAGMPGAINSFISVSEFSQSIIEAYLPRNARLYPVPNPICLDRERRADVEAQSQFLYLGRLSPEKGATLFAEAAKEARVPSAFAGDGPCADEIVSANPTAKMLGWLDTARVSSTLRASRALVLPSLWYETYGLSVMEAAALGVPAIVPDTSASRDLVVDNETGLWFEGGNRDSLVAKLGELSRPGVAKRLGSAAYDRFWKNPPTMDSHVHNLLEVYETVLKDAA